MTLNPMVCCRLFIWAIAKLEPIDLLRTSELQDEEASTMQLCKDWLIPLGLEENMSIGEPM